MTQRWRNSLAIVITVLIGFILIYVGTDGFHAFTEESARTYKLNKEKPLFPEVMFEDSHERIYPFSEFSGKYVLMTFIYTECTDVCPQLEMNVHEIYQQIPENYLDDEIVFLTISFDPERDDPETLKKYQGFFNSDGESWRMARINDEYELENLLNQFGVTVIPDGEGGFVHNSAFYLVNKEGYLQEVMDYEQVDEAAEKVLATIED